MNRIIIYLFLFLSLACSRNSGQPNNSEIEKNTTVTEENSSQTTNDSLTTVSQNEDIPKNGLAEDSADLNNDQEAELSLSYLTLEWDTWRTLIIILGISFLILLIASISMFRRNTSLNNDVTEKNGKLNDKNASIRNLEFEINNLKSRIKKRNSDTLRKKDQSESKTTETLPTPASNRVSVVEETGAYEKEWSIKKEDLSNSQSPMAVQKILYADKATENKIFSSVSEQKNEHRSVFKLILENGESEKAEFEIVDSDFALKMAANSPDTYLYPVCKPENSNQNYSGEIITTKRGIAHKVDGKWKVNEDDKATIKFQ